MATETSPDPDGKADLLADAEVFVKEKFKNHDPSHDWHHVHRVRLMAMNLSRCSSLKDTPPNMLVLELAALFHDLCDRKYVGEGSKGPVTAALVLAPFMEGNSDKISEKLDEESIQTLYRIVDSVSWSKEEARLDRIKRGGPYSSSASDEEQIQWESTCPEFQCVSDADRLDAIGSIGILRVAAFSAVKNRPLHIPPANPQMDSVPPAEQAEGYNDSAVAHFHSKLLKIRGDRLKTTMARQEAERRQVMMASFLQELDFEWMVADQGAQMSLLTD